jgi:hypothetical protein
MDMEAMKNTSKPAPFEQPAHIADTLRPGASCPILDHGCEPDPYPQRLAKMGMSVTRQRSPTPDWHDSKLS